MNSRHHRLDPVLIALLLTSILGGVVWFLALVGAWHLLH